MNVQKYKYNIDTGKICEKELLNADSMKAFKEVGVENPCGSKEKLRE